MSEFLMDETEEKKTVKPKPEKKTVKPKPEKKTTSTITTSKKINKLKERIEQLELKLNSLLTDEEKQEIKKKIIKMFNAAKNGKNYYMKWFPELKDTGDFYAAFITLVNKL